jgi:hypothetical protein
MSKYDDRTRWPNWVRPEMLRFRDNSGFGGASFQWMPATDP